MKAKLMFSMVLAAAGTFAAVAADYRPGFRETDGVTVEADQTVSLDGTIAVGDKGRFVKAGDGTLSLSMSQISASGNTRVAVVGGTLAATPGADATASLQATSVVTNLAAFWVNEESVVVTNGANGVEYASKWCDVRETNPTTPTRIFALPRWYDGTGTAGTKQGIDPCVETKDGVRAVYFGGVSSGQYMRWFQRSGSTVNAMKIQHFFVVHGAYACWGNVLGCVDGGTRNGGFVVGLSNTVPSLDSVTAHFPGRLDCCPDLLTARFFLDGEYIDVRRVPPKRGFQLLEGCSTTYPFKMDNFFRTAFETFKNAQGGDYIAEAMVFTNLLTEAERLDVERYLMKKWNLPSANGTYLDSNSVVTRNNLPPPTLQVGVAEGSVFSYTSSSDTSRGLSFSGSGTVRVSGSGTTVLGVDDGQPWSGTFEWDGAGGLLAKGGAFPPLDAKGGEAYACANNTPTSGNTAATDKAAGLRLTRSAAATSRRRSGIWT